VKKLGIIGGYSYKSTIYYYEKIVYALRGQCDITIRSIDYTIFDRHTEANDLNGLRMFLQEAVNDLLMVGCEIIAIACNTAHIVKEKLEFGKPSSSISLVPWQIISPKRVFARRSYSVQRSL
jgi:aspartate racemase